MDDDVIDARSINEGQHLVVRIAKNYAREMDDVQKALCYPSIGSSDNYYNYNLDASQRKFRIKNEMKSRIVDRVGYLHSHPRISHKWTKHRVCVLLNSEIQPTDQLSDVKCNNR